MSPSPSPVLSYAVALTMGQLYTMVIAPVTMTTVAPEPTTGTIVHGGPSLQHPFNDGIFYRGVGVRQIQDIGKKADRAANREDGYPSGVGGGAAASCCVRPPSASAGADDAQSAADSALHPIAAPPSCSLLRGGPRSCPLRQRSWACSCPHAGGELCFQRR